jgi:tetratricopeptide (TPR) repeat protein
MTSAKSIKLFERDFFAEKRKAGNFLLLVFILFFLNVKARDPYADSLKKALSLATQDTTKLNLLLSLSEVCEENEILNYARPAAQLAEKLISQLSPGKEKEKSQLLLAKASALNNIGYLYNRQGQVGLALEYYYQCLSIYERLSDQEGIANSLNNSGFIYLYQDLFEKARENFERSLSIRKKIGHKEGIFVSNNNLGLLYEKTGDFERALNYHLSALKAAEDVNDKQSIATSLNNIGVALRKKGDHKAAVEYYRRGLAIQEEIQNKPGICFALSNLGHVFIEQGEIRKALDYGTRSMKTAQELAFPEYIRDAADLLAKVYDKTGDEKASLEMLELYFLMRDSLNNRATKSSSIKKSFQYEYEKKKVADSTRNASVEIVNKAQLSAENARLERRHTQSLFLICGLLALVCGLLVIVNRFRLTQKQKKTIEEQKRKADQAYAALQVKNKETLDSIHYAKRIQQALLPAEAYIQRVLKRKAILLICFFSFAAVSLKAQYQSTEPLKAALKNAAHDSVRLRLLVNLTEICELEEIPGYAQEALTLADKLLRGKDNVDRAKLIGYKADVINNLGFFYQNSGQNAKALGEYFASLELRKEVGGKKGIGGAYNNIGYILNLQGNIPAALDYYHRSLAIMEELNDKKGTCVTLNNIAYIYQHQNESEKALAYYRRMLDIGTEIKDLQEIGSAKLNLASMYEEQKNYALAIKTNLESIEIYGQMHDSMALAITANNLGDVYLSLKDTASAYKWFLKSLDLNAGSMDMQGRVVSMNNIGGIYFQQGKIREAEKAGQECLTISQKLGYPLNISRAANLLYNVYKAQKRFGAAKKMFVLMYRMTDSLSNLETKKASIKKQFQYEYEKKNAADSVRMAEQQKVRRAQLVVVGERLSKEKIQSGFLAGGLAFVALGLIFVVNRFRVARKQKKIIEAQKLEVDEAFARLHEKNKEVLDSIIYARKIQGALLASESYIERVLSGARKKSR